METRRCVLQFLDCQKIGIILLIMTLCPSSSSSSNEVKMGEAHPGFNDATVGHFCSFKKFIMESYFEKYDTLLDSKFQDFIADEILSSCKLPQDNLLPRVSVSHRQLTGEGSHRRLSSIVRFQSEPASLSELPNHFCNVIIVERLPHGVFADPFELQHLIKHGDTNLELPSFLSNRSAVEIHMSASPNFSLGGTDELEIRMDLPLHARYQPLDDSGYTEVEIGALDLFMHCSLEGNSSEGSFLFRPTFDVAESYDSIVVWRIPSGKREHVTIVSVVTFLAAFSSALLIAVTSLLSSDVKLGKIFKKS